MLALLDSGEMPAGGGGTDGAELSGTAADVQHADVGFRHEKPGRHPAYFGWRPVTSGEPLDRVRINQVELVIPDEMEKLGIKTRSGAVIKMKFAEGHDFIHRRCSANHGEMRLIC